MRKLTVALQDKAATSAVTPIQLEWDELVDLLTTHEEREEKDGAGWIPASFSQPKRANANVTAHELAVFDIDEDEDCTEEATNALEQRLIAKGYAFVIHSTHSGCLRLVVPYDAPVLPHAVSATRAALVAELGLRPDPATNDLARFYYLPSCPPGAEPYTASSSGRWASAVSARAPASHNVAPEAEAVDLEPIRERAKNHPDVLKFLNGEFAPVPGTRNSRFNAMLSELAFLARGQLDERAIESLLVTNLSRMDTSGDGYDAFLADTKDQYRRAAKARAEKKGHLDSIYRAKERLQKEPNAVFEESWKGQLVVRTGPEGTERGLQSVGLNVKLILENDERLKGTIRMNVLSKGIEVSGGALATESCDHLHTALSNWLMESEYKLNISRDECRAQLVRVADNNRYNPVVPYLEKLTWDGTPRIESFFIDYCGAEGNVPYLQGVARNFFVGAVARAMRPGCHLHDMLVLLGEQGAGKSRLIEALGEPWSKCTSISDVRSKDALMVINSGWIVEIAELAALRHANAEEIKGFITTPSDTFRLPYAAQASSFPRVSLLVGTTNKDNFLQDETGNRRFKVVRVRKALVERVREERDQLWAEAVVLFKAGQRWHFTDAENEEIGVAAEAALYEQLDDAEAVAEIVEKWFLSKKAPRPEFLQLGQLTQDLAVITGQNYSTRAAQNTLTRALKLLGFHATRRIMRDRQQRVWVTPDRLITMKVES